MKKGDEKNGKKYGNNMGRKKKNYKSMKRNESGKGSEKDVNGNSGGGRE
jgi:hypothetical protein